MARRLNNHVSSVWNIVNQNNWYFLKGAPSGVYRGEYVMNFQSVLAIPLTQQWSLVFRLVIPLESVPYVRSFRFVFKPVVPALVKNRYSTGTMEATS